ncbi:Rubrerythrin [Xylanibacter ruminicola]|uniref:Rubrerythrin n=1 Tax=Xylanibacter ruminicola TaxID=839 RepID=A0A1H4A2D4_XYLRU|nr:ferritin family protein [Xylanibacter ruminicola]SEA30199.1 Rubrerythrin [Xylanibacter ruminicola]
MIYGKTKDTDFEKLCDGAAKAEAQGVMVYYALARMAREQGYPEEVSTTFIEMANQEAVHAGFYATLMAKYDSDIWKIAENFAKGEYHGEQQVNQFAQALRAIGLDEAADEMDVFAKQERHHGDTLTELISKYKK